MILLNRFSAHLVSETTIFDMADALVKEVERTANVKRVILLILDKDGLLQSVNKAEIDPYIKEIAQWVKNEAKAVGLPVHTSKSESGRFEWPVSLSFLNAGFQDRHDIFIPLQTTSRLEGVLYIGERADGKLHSFKNAQLLVSVANQAAAFLERKQLQSIAVQADALREADKLKTTLVSSVSHELKTPLASVTATISNLLEQDMEWDNEHVREELEACAGRSSAT